MDKRGIQQASSSKRNFVISNKGTFNTNKKMKSTQQTNSTSGSFFTTSTEDKIESNQKSIVKYTGNNKRQKDKNVKYKKPFDKKKWRMQRYSKKYRLEQWENKRKKHVLNEYYKEVKDDEPKFDVQKIYEKYGDVDDENENNLNNDLALPSTSTETDSDLRQQELRVKPSNTKKNKAFKNAQAEFQRIQNENKQRKEEIIQEKAERAEALKQYKAQKLEKYKKLNKKTKKGQPILKYRMEMLLEQIQKSMS